MLTSGCQQASNTLFSRVGEAHEIFTDCPGISIRRDHNRRRVDRVVVARDRDTGVDDSVAGPCGAAPRSMSAGAVQPKEIVRKSRKRREIDQTEEPSLNAHYRRTA